MTYNYFLNLISNQILPIRKNLNLNIFISEFFSKFKKLRNSNFYQQLKIRGKSIVFNCFYELIIILISKTKNKISEKGITD